MTEQLHSVTENALALTKLNRPRVSGQISLRSHLTDRLDAATNLTLVIAPAGYGKTTLLSAWLNGSPRLSTWLSLDEHDNDLVAFLSYLVAAVRRLFPTACTETLSLLNGMALPSIAVISRSLLNELAAIQEDFILVLDDYHLINDHGIHEVMTELARRPPPGLHLVLAARYDPTLPLVSLRARGHVVELREADLRFSLEETATFLRTEVQHELDAQTVLDLRNNTEGWIAGLRLSVLYFQHTGATSWVAMDQRGYNRYVMSYLFAEVLAHVPPLIREFLVKTSILDQFCQSLGEAVTGISDADGGSHACIEWLQHNNVFFVSVDEEQRWFRYHRLFRKLLRDQLEQGLGRNEVNALHGKASEWYAAHGFAEEALQHALAAGDTESAVQIVARFRRELTNEEQWQRLERWVRLFAREVVNQSAELLLCEVWFMINRQYLSRIPPLLDQVEAVLAQGTVDEATAQRLQGEVDVRRATLDFYAGHSQRSLAAAQAALEKIPAEWWLLRAQARLFASVGYLAGGDQGQAYATLYNAGEPDFGVPAQMRLLINACFIHWIAADLSSVAQAANQILAHSDELRSQTETITWARYHLAACHYERNELDEAEQLLILNLRQRYQTHMQCLVNSVALLALIDLAQGRSEQAREVTAQMVAYTLEIGSAVGHSLAKAFEAELALRQARLAEATHWMEHNVVPIAVPRPLFYRPPSTLVKILLAHNTPDSRQQAAQVLALLYDYNGSIHYTVSLIEVLALQALLFQAEGRRQDALAALLSAVDLAESGGIVRLFVDLGEPMAKLLQSLVRDGTTSTYAATVLAAFPPKVPAADRLTRANAALLSPLSARELEVLALLKERATDREIAVALVISADTVHSHVQHIADKLGVRGRRAVVQAAFEQGLLE